MLGAGDACQHRMLRCASRYEPGQHGLDEGSSLEGTASGQARWLVNLSWIVWIVLDPKTLGFLCLKRSRCFGLVLSRQQLSETREQGSSDRRAAAGRLRPLPKQQGKAIQVGPVPAFASCTTKKKPHKTQPPASVPTDFLPKFLQTKAMSQESGS